MGIQEVNAQNLSSQFGGKLGVAVYRIRYEQADLPPQAGWNIGGTANIPLGRSGLIRFMPEFGYLLSNTKGFLTDASPFFSNLSGTPLPDNTEIRILTHLVQGALLLKFSSNSDDKFGFFIGPGYHLIFNQTVIFEYPAPGQTETVQEIISGYDSEDPATYAMVYLGAELRLNPVEDNVGLYGYIHTYHQVDTDPFLPAGFTFGMKVLF